MAKTTRAKARTKAAAQAEALLVAPAAAPPAAPPAAPQILLEYATLQGQKLRVVIRHAPGIDYFVDVEYLKGDQWVPAKRSLKDLFSPVNSAIEVAILQLARQLSQAQEQIRTLQNPA